MRCAFFLLKSRQGLLVLRFCFTASFELTCTLFSLLAPPLFVFSFVLPLKAVFEFSFETLLPPVLLFSLTALLFTLMLAFTTWLFVLNAKPFWRMLLLLINRPQ